MLAILVEIWLSSFLKCFRTKYPLHALWILVAILSKKGCGYILDSFPFFCFLPLGFNAAEGAGLYFLGDCLGFIFSVLFLGLLFLCVRSVDFFATLGVVLVALSKLGWLCCVFLFWLLSSFFSFDFYLWSYLLENSYLGLRGIRDLFLDSKGDFERLLEWERGGVFPLLSERCLDLDCELAFERDCDLDLDLDWLCGSGVLG